MDVGGFVARRSGFSRPRLVYPVETGEGSRDGAQWYVDYRARKRAQSTWPRRSMTTLASVWHFLPSD